MKYEKIAEYSDTKFRRITGVKRATFDKMVEILRKGYAEKHQRRGRTPKLSIEDLLLATLEYLREYRTYAHIAASYGIAESNIYRGIKWVEDTLIRDGSFSLPGRKAPLKCETEYEVILVDATARQSSEWRDHCARIFQRKEARFPAIQGFRYPCQGRNGAGGGYQLPGACSHTREFPPAKKASQASSLDQAGTQ